MKDESMTALAARARAFAVEAHGAQTYGGAPYVMHLDAVAAILVEFGFGGGEIAQIAYLHDTVEDCEGVDAAALAAEGFSEAVIQAVLFCTDAEGPNRKSRKSLTYARWRASIDAWVADPDAEAWVPDAVRVKLADRLANVRQCVVGGNQGLFDMYAAERASFREALAAEGIAEAMWAAYDGLLAARP